MAKYAQRRIEVEGKSYLWGMWHHELWGWGGWSATLRVYSAASKTGMLEVRYAIQDYATVFPNARDNVIVYRWTNERGLDVHAPRTVVRVIRYARKQLGLNPEQDHSPLVISNGYQLLRDIGYDTVDTAPP